MYLATLFTALVAGALAVEPILTNNEWIHLLGKKNTLDSVLKPLLPILDWNSLAQVGKRNSLESWLPLQLSKKRDILQGSSTSFNPLSLSKRTLDLASFWSPGVDSTNYNLQQQLLQALGGKRGSQDLISQFTGDGFVPFLPYLINSKKRDILATGGSGVFSIKDLINPILSKRNIQSIQPIDWSILQPLLLSKKRDILSLGGSGSSLQDLINQISSKRNLQSILPITDLGIIPFNPNLILSKKRDVVFDPFNTNPLIISKKRDILFDPLHPNVISKKSIWNPLIDIVLPPPWNPLIDNLLYPIKDVV